jgi:very-short-patch-repair endonuclease
MTELRLITAVTERQHGLVTTAQLIGLGVSDHQLQRLLDRGILVRCASRVHRLGGSPPTAAQQLLAAVLAAGPRAALSHTTALAHWGVRGFISDPVHVTRHRDEGDRPVRGTVVHEVRDLPTTEIRVLDDIPVVAPALALLQLAGMRGVHPERVARALDAAWSDRLVSFRSLDALVARMSQRGRAGLQLLRELVQERGPDHVPPASNLEARVAKLLVDAGLPAMRRQVDSGDGAGWIGRVDFRAEARPVILEVQSERFHRSLTSRRDDETRLGALRRAGFEVVEVTDVDVFHRPELLIERLNAAHRRIESRRRAA